MPSSGSGVAGSANELAYAEITSNAAVTATLADVTGLSITFTAGTRSVMLEAYVGLMTVDTIDKFGRITIADSSNVQQVLAQDTISVANGGLMLFAKVRKGALTPGTSYTFKVRAAVGSAATGTINASSTGPVYIQAYEV